MEWKKMLAILWEGKDLWFPKSHTVLFEYNDEGALGYATLYEDHPAFKDAADADPDQKFYDLWVDEVKAYVEDDPVACAKGFAGTGKCVEITYCGQAVKAVEEASCTTE